MKNRELKKRYDSVYRGGSTKFYTFNAFPASRLVMEMVPSWEGLEVLEIGCGEGRLASLLSFAGAARVDAVDYSPEAIKLAKERFNLPNVRFQARDFRGIRKRYDVVVMQGVLEHFDKPFEILKRLLATNVREGGAVVTASPSFLNPRGYVWMTLQLLFDVPMSLTDLHFICPFDMEAFAAKNGFELVYRSGDQDWGAGERTIVDFRRRLPNALRDAGMPVENVDRLLAWLEKAVAYHGATEASGATVAYKLSRSAGTRALKNSPPPRRNKAQ